VVNAPVYQSATKRLWAENRLKQTIQKIGQSNKGNYRYASLSANSRRALPPLLLDHTIAKNAVFDLNTLFCDAGRCAS
jgi:hypothetical protein